MKSVRIAELKNRLSEYLHVVRRGQAVTVLDRDTPVARIIPYQVDSASIVIRRPSPRSPGLQKILLPPPLRLKSDVVELLLQERQGDR